MNSNAQGALEYLLLIGGAVLVAVIIISIVSGMAKNSEAENTVNIGSNAIKNAVENAIDQLEGGGTAGCGSDADCSAPTPRCKLATGECVECLENDDYILQGPKKMCKNNQCINA